MLTLNPAQRRRVSRGGALPLRWPVRAPLGWLLLAVLVAAGCKGPTNHRNWSANQAVLPTADFDGNLVTIHNVRNTEYRTAEDYTVHHYDKTYDLAALDKAYFVMVPLPEVPGGAHTFVSFGFDNGEHVAISVEVRREKGEEFSALRSVSEPYEIMYVVGDERDLIQVRTIHWLEDVYMYKAKAQPAQIRALFVDMLERANKLSKQPEYYNLVTNNCTTNIVRHINNVSPGRIPYTHEVLFPAYSDRLAFQLGMIETEGNFTVTKERARINELAYIHRADPDFSVKIRPQIQEAVARRRAESSLR